MRCERVFEKNQKDRARYHVDNYDKDAQRLASLENDWIDIKQEQNEFLEQIPEGKRPDLE